MGKRRRKFDREIFFLILTSGIFYGLSYPPINLYFLIFFSLAILINLVLKCEKVKQVIFRTYSVIFIAGLIAISWISLSGIREGADPFLIFGGIGVLVIYPLFFVPPMILFFVIFRYLGSKKLLMALLSFPFLWTAFEYLAQLSQVSFPWLFAGNTQTYNPEKIQFIEYTGLFGVSFWICLISALLYYLYFKIQNNHWIFVSYNVALVLSIIILLYFLPDFYTSLHDCKNEYINYNREGTIKVGIVQPNINPWKKWGGKQMELINDYIKMMEELRSENPDVGLIVMPETALPYYFRERIFEDKYEVLRKYCDSINIPVLIGTPDLEFYKDQSEAPNDAKIMKSSGLKYDTYNSAFLFEPGKDKDIYQKHYKMKLVAGSERMPYQELLPFTKNLIEWGVGLGNWQLGYDTTLFILDNKYKFNTAICYESVYPEFFADFVNKGADFSVIITNDGWWGKFFGTYQHNQFAVPRAIENRRWIVRCANTGISDFIDPYGIFYKETKIDEKTKIVHDVGIKKEKTFYTEHGDIFSRFCILCSIIILIVSLLMKRTVKKRKDI